MVEEFYDILDDYLSSVNSDIFIQDKCTKLLPFLLSIIIFKKD